VAVLGLREDLASEQTGSSVSAHSQQITSVQTTPSSKNGMQIGAAERRKNFLSPRAA